MTYVTERTITAIGILFPCLAVISFTLRVQAQRQYAKAIEIDALFAIPAGILTIGAGIAMTVGAQIHVLGGHTLTAEADSKIAKFEYAFWPVHVWAMGLIKLSILFFFRRIFKGRTKRTPFDYANWTLITLTALWTVIFFLTDILACGDDPSAAWRSLISLRHECMDTFSMMLACGVISWVLDVAILVEPLLVIGKLNMDRKRKIQASLVFLFSTFAVVAGLLRMIIMLQIRVEDTVHPTTRILGTDLLTIDQVGVISILLFWTYIEIGVGFVVACLPPSARYLDKFSAQPLLTGLRSLTSLRAILSSRRSRGSGEGRRTPSEISQESWERMKHMRDEYQMTNISAGEAA